MVKRQLVYDKMPEVLIIYIRSVIDTVNNMRSPHDFVFIILANIMLIMQGFRKLLIAGNVLFISFGAFYGFFDIVRDCMLY